MRSEATSCPYENVYKPGILAFPGHLARGFVIQFRAPAHSLGGPYGGGREGGAYSDPASARCPAINMASLEAWKTRSPKAGRIASRWSKMSDCTPS